MILCTYKILYFIVNRFGFIILIDMSDFVTYYQNIIKEAITLKLNKI